MVTGMVGMIFVLAAASRRRYTICRILFDLTMPQTFGSDTRQHPFKVRHDVELEHYKTVTRTVMQNIRPARRDTVRTNAAALR